MYQSVCGVLRWGYDPNSDPVPSILRAVPSLLARVRELEASAEKERKLSFENSGELLRRAARLEEALAWAVGFIRCNLPKTSAAYPDMRNAEDLLPAGAGLSGEFHRACCRAEVAEDRVRELEAEVAELRTPKIAVQETPKQWSTAQAPTLESIAATARQITTAEENKKLHEAIRDAGFEVMKTSGKWSIHDVSEKAKADEQQTAEVIAENIELEAEVARLREGVETVRRLLVIRPDSAACSDAFCDPYDLQRLITELLGGAG